MLIRRTRFDTPCRIEIEQSEDHFHAHLELEGAVPIGPGDRVLVHGGPISIPFGGRAVIERIATVELAGPLRRGWTKFAAMFELKELYEVSFSPGRIA
jgi:hypothetical protein